MDASSRDATDIFAVCACDDYDTLMIRVKYGFDANPTRDISCEASSLRRARHAVARRRRRQRRRPHRHERHLVAGTLLASASRQTCESAEPATCNAVSTCSPSIPMGTR